MSPRSTHLPKRDASLLLERMRGRRSVTPPPPSPGAPELELLSLLGEGGGGEVWRARDPTLNRTIALKRLRQGGPTDPSLVARFVAEAQVTAQLQHPGVVPVHTLGTLPDGRAYYTMREVRGRTLTEVLRDVHAASVPGEWREAGGWTLRRLVDALRSVCECVGYAHARGVVHRDLKPDNVMIGGHGEVLVLDWGLAKLAGTAGPEAPIRTVRTVADAHTRVGSVAGTLRYMAPEQARGRIDQIDARTDVYALGAILYEILSGRPPYDETITLARVRREAPAPLHAFALRLPIPRPLAAAVDRAMARSREDRFADGDELAAEIRAWLDGIRQREQALAFVAGAAEADAEALRLRERATSRRAEAELLARGVRSWEPEEAKLELWSLQDEAEALRVAAERRASDAEVELQAALRVSPDLPEAHAALAVRYREAHRVAERDRDAVAAAIALGRMDAHARALPMGHGERIRCEAWSEGRGTLALSVDAAGAVVALHRYETLRRRLVPVLEAELRAPIPPTSVPHGSWLAVVRAPGRATIRVPILVGRGESFDASIPLPRADELGPDDVFVAPGWFWAGHRHPGTFLPWRRLWCDGFVIRRCAVTNREYLHFLDDLVRAGREEEALRYAPRQEGANGAPFYAYADGRFTLQPDPDGDLWDPDWPVLMVDHECARAYARWAARRDGLPWRLPGELEWEKAARGVDGRTWPWGDHMEPSWTCLARSHPGRPLPARVGTHPVDESPYGARDMAGNAMTWCGDPGFDRDQSPPLDGDRVLPPEVDPAPGGLRPLRGGCWDAADATGMCASRRAFVPDSRFNGLGFRLVRSWTPRAG